MEDVDLEALLVHSVALGVPFDLLSALAHSLAGINEIRVELSEEDSSCIGAFSQVRIPELVDVGIHVSQPFGWLAHRD